MTPTTLVLAMLSMSGERAGSAFYHRAIAAAPVLLAEAGDDALVIAAMAIRESSVQPTARGALGEVGLLQIAPSTGKRLCRDLVYKLRQTRANVQCSMRVVREVKRLCGNDPRRWLSRYNGGPCRRTRYSTRVLALVRKLDTNYVARR